MYPLHKFCGGRGKDVLKKVSNFLSLLHRHLCLCLNNRDRTSPNRFCYPSKCFVANGDERFARCQIVSIRSSRFAIADIFDAPRVCHATVSDLLLHTPTCSHFFEIRTSRTSQTSSSAAIPRSELIISPALISLVTTVNKYPASIQRTTHFVQTVSFLAATCHLPPFLRNLALQ